MVERKRKKDGKVTKVIKPEKEKRMTEVRKKGRDIEANGNERRVEEMIKVKKKEKTKKLKEMNEMKKREDKGNATGRWIDSERERKEIRN